MGFSTESFWSNLPERNVELKYSVYSECIDEISTYEIRNFYTETPRSDKDRQNTYWICLCTYTS